jgi:hypothetical protein
MSNARYLISRNKREGWYFEFKGRTRKHGKCFSLRSYAKRMRDYKNAKKANHE